jgi:hypothetical protein
MHLLNTYSFDIDYDSPTGDPFHGKFTVHRPTVGEHLRIGVSEANYLGGLTNVDIQTAMLARMVATLEVVVDKSPDWWKPREMRDVEVVQEVYDKVMTYLRQFQRQSKLEAVSEGKG